MTEARSGCCPLRLLPTYAKSRPARADSRLRREIDHPCGPVDPGEPGFHRGMQGVLRGLHTTGARGGAEVDACWLPPAGCRIKQRLKPGRVGGANPARLHKKEIESWTRRAGGPFWAVGDVTGKMMLAQPPLQGSVRWRNILGHSRLSITAPSPPPTFTIPEISSWASVKATPKPLATSEGSGSGPPLVRATFKTRTPRPWPNSFYSWMVLTENCCSAGQRRSAPGAHILRASTPRLDPGESQTPWPAARGARIAAEGSPIPTSVNWWMVASSRPPPASKNQEATHDSYDQ